MELTVIARMRSPFLDKFGIPRQSGLADSIEGLVVFEPNFRVEEALRGLEAFSHLWLIWGFSAREGDGWSPTVRPPRLGGDRRMGVFATRSPNRPNALGLSTVRLLKLEHTVDGICLRVAGADLMDGTPIYDIKPYLPYTDSHPEAKGGYAHDAPEAGLKVVFPPDLLNRVPETLRAGLREALAQDPRPAYQADPARRYGLRFGAQDVRFIVADGVLRVVDVVPLPFL